MDSQQELFSTLLVQLEKALKSKNNRNIRKAK